jgi:hypothetical protein
LEERGQGEVEEAGGCPKSAPVANAAVISLVGVTALNKSVVGIKSVLPFSIPYTSEL